MKRLLPFTILCFFLFCSNAYAQRYVFYPSNQPRFIKPGTVSDTLENALTGGINNPLFSNMDFNNDGKQDLFVFDRTAERALVFLYTPQGFKHAPEYELAFPYLRDWVLLRDYNLDGKMDIFTNSNFYSRTDSFVYVQEPGFRILKNVSGSKLAFEQINNQLYDTGAIMFGSPSPASPLVTSPVAIPAIDDIEGDGDVDIIANAGASLAVNFYDNYIRNPQNITYPADTTVFIIRDMCWGNFTYDFNSNSGVLALPTDQIGGCYIRNYASVAKKEKDPKDPDTGNTNDNDGNAAFAARKHMDIALCMIDIDNDGIADLLYSDSEYRNVFLLKNGRLTNPNHIDTIVSQDTLFLSNTGLRRKFLLYPSMFQVDVNADGKKELVISTNSVSAERLSNNIWIFENNGTASNPDYQTDESTDFLYNTMIDLGQRSAPVFTDVDKDGDLDLVVATTGNLEQTQNQRDRLYLFKNTGTATKPVFELADTNFANISGTGTTGSGILQAMPSFGDLNGDGKDDLVLGQSSGDISYYINESNGSTYTYTLVSSQLGAINVGTYSAPQIIDLDKDGLNDLVIGCRKGNLKYFKNAGTATAPVFASEPTIDSLGKVFSNEVKTGLKLDPYTEQYGNAVPFIVDLDKDGVYEMLLGGVSGQIALYSNVSATPGAVFTKEDKIFLPDASSNEAAAKRFGQRLCIAVADLDGDGKQDMMLGNIAGGLQYYSSVAIDTTHVGLDKGQISKTDIAVYPNPASDIVSFRLNNINQSLTYEVYDVTGRMMKSGHISAYHSIVDVRTDDLREGLYFIRFSGNGSLSLVKQLLIAR